MKENIKENIAVFGALGALKSPFDARDYKLVAATETFPDTFELPTVTVKNQGSVGSCVAHAASSVVEYHHKRQHNEKVVFSTEFIYGLRDIGYYVGEGMYPRNALNTLKKYGDVPFADLQGNHTCSKAMENVNANLDELKDKAYPHRISSYFRIYNENAVKNALINHGYVLVSMPWHQNVQLVDGVYTYSGKSIGGHAIIIYGWNEKGWLCQNSWGTNFGDKGRFIIPFNFKFTEMWGITDNITNDIVRPKSGKIWDVFYKIYNEIINFFTRRKN